MQSEALLIHQRLFILVLLASMLLFSFGYTFGTILFIASILLCMNRSILQQFSLFAKSTLGKITLVLLLVFVVSIAVNYFTINLPMDAVKVAKKYIERIVLFVTCFLIFSQFPQYRRRALLTIFLGVLLYCAYASWQHLRHVALSGSHHSAVYFSSYLVLSMFVLGAFL